LEALKSVWSGKDQDRCVTLCERLRAAGIPFKVSQSRRQYLLSVDERYRIGVPAEFFNEAKEVIIKGRLRSKDSS